MNLFAFGLGYSVLHLVRSRRDRFARVAGTVRSPEKAAALVAEGIEARVFAPGRRDPRIEDDLAGCDLLVVSIPPAEAGDPVLETYGAAIAETSRLAWIGYLSTIGVYGDHGGHWIDESTPPEPRSSRARRRVEAEVAWLDLGAKAGKAVQVFRLAGIYGPGRNALANLADGTARRIVKPGQVFNRIHVDDIAAVLMASVARPRAGAIYNVTDDEPAAPGDVVAFAAALAGVEPPPETSFEAADLSPMARSFYAANRRASNRLVTGELGLSLAFPTYREGLRALRTAGEGP